MVAFGINGANTRTPGLSRDQEIVAMRNRLIHAYFDVDLNVVWEVVRDDLPVLDAFVRRTLARSRG
jgi:uncharacterized protein with HEPN domain